MKGDVKLFYLNFKRYRLYTKYLPRDCEDISSDEFWWYQQTVIAAVWYATVLSDWIVVWPWIYFSETVNYGYISKFNVFDFSRGTTSTSSSTYPPNPYIIPICNHSTMPLNVNTFIANYKLYETLLRYLIILTYSYYYLNMQSLIKKAWNHIICIITK